MQSPKKYTNRLINETSPYLLQHAHNPVDWYSWGEEAFERAKAEDKPVLVSIGYSACHWCHVMEHESFEDEATAAIMNENFINIKVDMEERPDVDRIYMDFVQMTTGSGGWPLNVFMSPYKLPFFGGTYFPPVGRFNRPSFQRVLTSVADAWATSRDELLASANEVVTEMRRAGLSNEMGESLSADLLENAFQVFGQTFDAANGGFGGAPKFPPTMGLEFLLRYYRRTNNPKALEMAAKTAAKMAQGGIYDQLGGGFHRYSVDAVWLVPHFEKMLYDNAQLVRLYLHLFQVTGDQIFKTVAVGTLEYIKREMTHELGGFFSAQDADSEGVEGKFFVWTPAEIEAILGSDAAVFCFYYDVSEDGNFEEKNILNVKNTIEETAVAFGLEPDGLREILEDGRAKLFAVREKRIKPFRDEKVLTAWNGLMLAAFAEAAAVLNRPDFLETAKRNADFVIGNMQTAEGALLRTWKDGRAKLSAYLEDYANMADGLTELFQVCGDVKYLREAKRLADLLITEFWDNDDGGFFFTAKNHEELIVRKKDYFDNATPSGNSVAADVLLKLAKLTGEELFERFAVAVMRIAAAQIKRYPQAFGRVLSALEFYLGTTKEIVLLGDSEEMRREIWREFVPNKVVVLADRPSDDVLVPLLNDRILINGVPTAYVCENFACQKPVTNAEDLREQLR